jgi:histidine phosphotransfer protein HptB
MPENPRVQTPLIDLLVFEALQANAGADFVRHLVEAFAEEAPLLLAAMHQAVAAGDTEGLKTKAHSLKSNAIAFGAARLATFALRIEQEGLRVEPGAAAAAIDALCTELGATITALRTQASL